MYCLPYPHDSRISPIRVPYHDCAPYSVTSPYTFQTYIHIAIEFEKLRLVYTRLVSGADPKSSTTPFASVLQSWLFFGLASEALGRDVRHEEFFEKAEEDSAEHWIDLRIPKWFWCELETRWHNLPHTLAPEQYALVKKRLLECFQIALTTLGVLDTDHDGDSEIALVLLSAHMLLYLIAKVLGDLKVLRASLRSKSTDVLVKRMLENGWCRKRLNHIEFVPLFYPALFFMSSLTLPRRRDENHEKCCSMRCTSRTALSQPLHRTEHCQCQNIGAPLDQVAKIITDGGIPLVRIEHLESGKMRIEVVPCERTTLFTAVSHVWADRQLGSAENTLPECQVRHLDSVLASLPRQVSHWRMCDWIPQRFSTPIPEGAIAPPSRTYELFWMDTFCIPQAPEHAYLRSKAIESMNLIYATAAQTLVFDAGLQDFDAGQRPSSKAHGGSHTFYGPTEEQLLDTLAYICASNWMGRAWTLQEGVLSHHLVFSLKGSLAYLRLLWPNYDAGGSLADIVELPLLRRLRGITRYLLGYSTSLAEDTSSIPSPENATEPLRACIRTELFDFAKSSLHVEEYNDYARGSTDRATRFVKFHGLLQSRSTTQQEDIPLLLMNMSGMNGNAVSQEKCTDARMQLLFYGLEIVPMEFLFSDCARVTRCTADSWIPTEIVPERFDGDYNLQLSVDGWKPKHKTGTTQPQFFLSPAAQVWGDVMIFSVQERDEAGPTVYRAMAPDHPRQQAPGSDHQGWCILIDEGSLLPCGALFNIVRANGSRRFLHFASILALEKQPASDNPTTHPTTMLLSSDPALEFILERSPTPQTLRMSRPQNPEQYSDRLIVVSEILYWMLCAIERRLLKYLLGARADNKHVIIAYTLITIRKPYWVENTVRAFVHHAWVATFQPQGHAHSRWAWFWALSNWEPPVPFKTMMKHFCVLLFFLYFNFEAWAGVMQICLYWAVVFPKEELVFMFVLAGLPCGGCKPVAEEGFFTKDYGHGVRKKVPASCAPMCWQDNALLTLSAVEYTAILNGLHKGKRRYGE